MSSSHRAVLGFERPDGKIRFCCTSAPLVYIQRVRDGTYGARLLTPDATLRWALRTDDYREGIRLRDLLNRSARDDAITIAERHGAPLATIATLQLLAIKASASGTANSIHAMAWQLLDASTDAVVVVDEPVGDADDEIDDADDETGPIDCPFAPLPDIGSGRDDIDAWADLSPQSFRLAIFDLDGTLLDTSMLDEARLRGDWRTVRERLDEVGAFPAWGVRAPHELVAELRNHGKQTAVVTRAPGWYADALLERFEIEPDHVVATCGRNKTDGFMRALRSAGVGGPVDTIVFGDDLADFTAAWAIQAWSFGNPWVNPAMTHFVMPDIAWWDAETLLAADHWRPVLTYVAEALDGHPGVWHRGSLVPIETDAWALGRYFPSRDARRAYPLSRAVLEQKERTTRVPLIAAAFDETVERMHAQIPVDVVLSVPVREGQGDRFAAYRTAVRELTGADVATVVTERQAPAYYKGWTKAQRRTFREGRFSVPDELSGQTVLIIDDVINTGSTIGAVADAAWSAGAERVLRLAFAANQTAPG